MEYSYEQVKTTYRQWGRHPLLYKIGCWITFLGQENKLRKLAIEELGLKPGDTVLDLACGTGLNHEFLEDVVGPEGKIIALDFSDEMLRSAERKAKEHNWRNITFIQGDAAKTTFDAKVDGVLSTLGISAIPQHKEALKNAINALKNGKKISILDAQLPSGLLSLFNPLIIIIYKRWANWDYTNRIPEDLRQLIGNAQTKRYNFKTIFIVHGTKNST